MADLRSLYVDLGYESVATHIATGNVIFDAPSPPPIDDLERAFEVRFGFASQVFLRTCPQLGDIVAAVPWRDAEVPIDVSFLDRAPDSDASAGLEATAISPEQLAVIGSEVYFLRGNGPGAETTHKESVTVRMLGATTTRRGLRTIEAIQERHCL